MTCSQGFCAASALVLKSPILFEPALQHHVATTSLRNRLRRTSCKLRVLTWCHECLYFLLKQIYQYERLRSLAHSQENYYFVQASSQAKKSEKFYMLKCKCLDIRHAHRIIIGSSMFLFGSKN